MIIDVTKADILNGIAENPYACPVSLAIQRATGIETVYVDNDVIHVSGFDVVTSPDDVQEFVDAYDAANEEVYPFTFTLGLTRNDKRLDRANQA